MNEGIHLDLDTWIYTVYIIIYIRYIRIYIIIYTVYIHIILLPYI